MKPGPIRLTLLLTALTVSSAWAQKTATPPAKPFVSMDPNARAAEIRVDPPETSAFKDPLPNGAAAPGSTPAAEPVLPPDNPMGGVWISLGNVGVTHGLFKITSDKVLMGHASEFGFGIGAQFDFSSFRVRAGLLHMSISPDESVTSAYPPGVLENSLSAFHLEVLYRWQFLEAAAVRVWGGVGGSMNYAFATSRSAEGQGAESNLLNSYGINLIGALGVDYPVTSWTDITGEFQWVPFSGYNVLVGFRSAL